LQLYYQFQKWDLHFFFEADPNAKNDYDDDNDRDNDEVPTFVAYTFDTITQPLNYYWDPNAQVDESAFTTSGSFRNGINWLVGVVALVALILV